MSDGKHLRWGILGTGGIAKVLAKAIIESRTGKLVAVGSRSTASAAAFGATFAVPHCYGSYAEVLADKEVDAVYISLPNHLHAEWTIKCAQAGKHVLCEKPFANHFGQAMEMVEAARYHDVFLLEAFMYRCHPQTARLVEIIQSGVLGEVKVLQINFAYNAPLDTNNIRHQQGAGGGAIVDVGTYTLSMARLIAGAATGKDFADPIELKAVAHINPTTRVDEYATAVVRFPGDIVANLACGSRVNVTWGATVFGTKGSLHVPNPWFPGKGDNTLELRLDGQPAQTITVTADESLYAIEVDTVAAYLAARQAPSPCMTWMDSVGQQQWLDQWRQQVGMVYDEEKDEQVLKYTSARQAPARRARHNMLYGRVKGVDKDISRLVMGTMIYHPGVQPFTNSMLDYFFEIGGNAIDTAHVYWGGQAEKAVGNWIRLRNNREQVVVIAKGAATVDATPELVEREFAITMDRLQLDHVDIYMMHRDNVRVPIGEFVDCLNRLTKAGKMRAFGGSNWSPARLQASEDYAAKHGLQAFTASSPNCSLALWNEPIWADCVHANDPASRAWYTAKQFPLFAWSSQAQGFFTGRYRPEDRSNADMVRCWYNAANWQRLERARELGKKKGVDATQIAAAYVLSQPFPTFALIGPRTLEETRTTAQGFDVHLTPAELAWLNLET